MEVHLIGEYMMLILANDRMVATLVRLCGLNCISLLKTHISRAAQSYTKKGNQFRYGYFPKHKP